MDILRTVFLAHQMLIHVSVNSTTLAAPYDLGEQYLTLPFRVSAAMITQGRTTDKDSFNAAVHGDSSGRCGHFP
ncbi:hypothetical protein AMATHDRAFT_55405 [Amanita thiersii Skay4041]|uniref:Uncharacterized protein n=1 Tax=Amanita thiersii Skay4041 TaxID=703135 RepID=A0A2A9NYU3_9AGAR|nr:hypothetical protein AMATHDRAFT_55405 [Amanita thiersii Skay4041]